MSIATSNLLKTGGWGTPKIDLGGCVLYLPQWRPELGGSTVKSQDQYAHSVTIAGTWGYQGRTLNGTTHETVIPDTAVLDLTSVTTLFWLNPSAAGNRGIVAKRTGTGGANVNYNIFLNAGYGLSTYNGAGEGVAANDTAFTQNVWDFGGMTWTGTSIIYYKSGIADGANTLAIGAANGHDLFIGSNGATEYFQGVIGDVFVYNRVLTAAEIAHVYQSTKWRYQ